MEVTFNDYSITYNDTTNTFGNTSISDVVRFFKGIFTNKERFISRFVNKYILFDDLKPLLNEMCDLYDNVEPFTIKEAFLIKDDTFRATVFRSINVTEMIEELGSERIAVEGKPVKRKCYDVNGEFVGYDEYDVIYELHKVNMTKLVEKEKSIREEKGNSLRFFRENNEVKPAYAVKCWCTSTDKEHWLFVEEKYATDPLTAIASTFRIHKNLIPHITELKRHGDILLVELNEDVKPEGEIVILTKEQYFSLLTAEG